MDPKMKIQDSIDYIEENLCEKIKLSDVAKKSYLSEFYFHRLFHAIVGDPLMEYVRKRRLSEAAGDLVKTEEKITEIALKYQFSSQESFSRAFKRAYGIAPREYRNHKGNIALYAKANVPEMGAQRAMPGGTALRMAA